MSASDTTHPTSFPAERVVASYGEGTPFPTYRVQLDGCGGLRCIIEAFGNVYEMTGRMMTPYRIVKRRPGQPDETVDEGITTNSRRMGAKWSPQTANLDWVSSDATEYKLIYMMAAGDGWEEMVSYDITPD